MLVFWCSPFSIEFKVAIVISFQSELSKLHKKSDSRTPRLWVSASTFYPHSYHSTIFTLKDHLTIFLIWIFSLQWKHYRSNWFAQCKDMIDAWFIRIGHNLKIWIVVIYQCNILVLSVLVKWNFSSKSVININSSTWEALCYFLGVSLYQGMWLFVVKILMLNRISSDFCV